MPFHSEFSFSKNPIAERKYVRCIVISDAKFKNNSERKVLSQRRTEMLCSKNCQNGMLQQYWNFSSWFSSEMKFQPKGDLTLHGVLISVELHIPMENGFVDISPISSMCKPQLRNVPLCPHLGVAGLHSKAGELTTELRDSCFEIQGSSPTADRASITSGGLFGELSRGDLRSNWSVGFMLDLSAGLTFLYYQQWGDNTQGQHSHGPNAQRM